MSRPFSDLPNDDPASLIQLLWERFLATLERFDGRDARMTDDAERLEIGLALEANALLLCAIPAPDWGSMQAKTFVAAWLRDQGTGGDTWTRTMVEVALERDTLVLQTSLFAN